MKKFFVPLQAFAALLLCSGMAWMVFVLASINPAPPTAGDLKARSTQDLSFVSMNSTAVALAKQMLAEMAPSPSGPLFMPVTGKQTATPGPEAAVTLKSVYTYVNTSTPYTFLFSPTAERKKQDTSTPAATSTVARNTPRPPTSTNVPGTKPPTQTAFPPTQTRPPTSTVVPTATHLPPTIPPPPTSTAKPTVYP